VGQLWGGGGGTQLGWAGAYGGDTDLKLYRVNKKQKNCHQNKFRYMLLLFYI
jgi:hypothetical protein